MSERRRQDRPRRTYQVCLACRARKVRCDVGDPDRPKFPCVRCRRLGLRCSQPGKRVQGESSQPDVASATSPVNTRQAIIPEKDTTRPFLLLENEVHDSNDAFNALVHASTSKSSPMEHASNQRHSDGGEEMPSMTSPNLAVHLTNSSYDVWSKCWLVKNNWLRPQQADWLVEKSVYSLTYV